MPQTATLNRRIVLAARPVGEPTADTLRLETSPVPKAGVGEMLLRTQYLSLDPYMRGRMSDAPSYAPPVELGAVMVGGTVAQVVESQLKGFAAGDWVLSYSGWQDYALSDGVGVTSLGRAPKNPSWALGVLGMPGMTAWAGLTQIGQPKAGETLCVAAATGPVGATVGQIGKILGCKVVGELVGRFVGFADGSKVGLLVNWKITTLYDDALTSTGTLFCSASFCNKVVNLPS